MRVYLFLLFFFFNDTATTEIYTLSLHDALPILVRDNPGDGQRDDDRAEVRPGVEDARGERALLLREPLGHGLDRRGEVDRKSTRLNSSHDQISYAVFCLKKKNKRRLRQLSH